MHSIRFLGALFFVAQLVACGGDEASVDSATGVITYTRARYVDDASVDEVVGNASAALSTGAASGTSGGSGDGVSQQTTTTDPNAPVCHEEGSDRNYVCTKCSTAHTDTITCVPRKVKVYGRS